MKIHTLHKKTSIKSPLNWMLEFYFIFTNHDINQKLSFTSLKKMPTYGIFFVSAPPAGDQ